MKIKGVEEEAAVRHCFERVSSVIIVKAKLEWESGYLYGRRQAPDVGRRMWKGGRSAKSFGVPRPPVFKWLFLTGNVWVLQLITLTQEKLWMEGITPLLPKSFFPFLLVPFFFLLIFTKQWTRGKEIKGKRGKYLLSGKEIKRRLRNKT